MMIKEMTKLYKKVNKMINAYEMAKTDAKNIDNFFFIYSEEAIASNMETAKRLEKTAKSLVKLATVTLNLPALFTEPVKVLCESATCSEETFCKWVLMNDVEFAQPESEEDEPENE